MMEYKDKYLKAIEVCPECDIEGCRHIREKRTAAKDADVQWDLSYGPRVEKSLGVKFALPEAAQQGWQCPICKAVYSPTMPFCTNCQGKHPTPANVGGDE